MLIKCIVISLLIFLSLNVFGQSYEDKSKIKPVCLDSVCSYSALKIADDLALKFTNREYISISNLIDTWESNCGRNEINQRSNIIYTISQGRSADALIMDYINEDFHYVFKYRMENSGYSDYDYIFEDYRTYYNFIPLRHDLDSVLMLQSRELSTSKSLSADEQLILILFSGEVKKFERKSKKNDFQKGYIPGYLAKDIRQLGDSELGVQLYAGKYTPLSENLVFGLSPLIGLGLTSPYDWKVWCEFAMKFRFHGNDQNFDFIALGDTNSVNSDLGFAMGLSLGYKIYESDNFTLIPKIGIGLEYIDTGLESYSDETQETEYYNVETLHTSLGVSLMKPIFRRNYIGLEINYHYNPYGWEKNLITKFDNSAYSAEIIFRF